MQVSQDDEISITVELKMADLLPPFVTKVRFQKVNFKYFDITRLDWRNYKNCLKKFSTFLCKQ